VHLPPEGSALSPELRGLVGLMPRLSAGADISTYCKNSCMSSTAYFATGCFWGAERRFWQMAGVLETKVGYMGGTRPNPSYEQVCTGVTGHAEMVKVIFDEAIVSYQRLLEEFWTMHDPTSLNQQGGDIGTQYRSAIFTTEHKQMETALASKAAYQTVLTAAGIGQICTEILPSEGAEFFEAEEYHQKYLQKNPNGYDCHSSTGVAYPI
jgi:peptide-methionine (S)-S-oxide reductase